MPVAARQLVRSASAADVREKEQTERDKQHQMFVVMHTGPAQPTQKIELRCHASDLEALRTSRLI